MRGYFLFFVIVFLLSCSGKEEKPFTGINYYEDGSVKEEFMCDKAGIYDGEYIMYYKNGVIKEKGSYIKGKLRGYQYKYDTTGQLSYLYFNILIYDSIFNFWDYNTDSIDVQNKISVINSYWKYKKDGSIDTLNSCFYKYHISDDIPCGDSVLFQLNIIAPYFKGNTNRFEIFFKETEDSEFIHYNKNMSGAFYEVKFVTRERGWHKSYFIVYEHNQETKEMVEHYGFAPYYVK